MLCDLLERAMDALEAGLENETLTVADVIFVEAVGAEVVERGEHAVEAEVSRPEFEPGISVGVESEFGLAPPQRRGR